MDNQLQGIQGAAQALTPQTPAVGVQPLQQENNQALKIAQKKKAQELQDYAEKAPAEQQSAISQALASLGNKSVAGKIGQAIATPQYAGYCLRYVDDRQGNEQRLPTAYADYQARSQAGQVEQSADKIPSGARVYFAPDNSNGQMGHVGISNGDGSFTSATDNGVKTFPIKDWEKHTGQQFIGWSK